MKAERPARLLLPPLSRPGRTRSRARAPDSTHTADVMDPADTTLFEALRNHRLEVAREEHIPPYRVASDRALRDIARLRPEDRLNLQLANGIGPNKAERYGDGLLEIVRRHPR